MGSLPGSSVKSPLTSSVGSVESVPLKGSKVTDLAISSKLESAKKQSKGNLSDKDIAGGDPLLKPLKTEGKSVEELIKETDQRTKDLKKGSKKYREIIRNLRGN